MAAGVSTIGQREIMRSRCDSEAAKGGRLQNPNPTVWDSTKDQDLKCKVSEVGGLCIARVSRRAADGDATLHCTNDCRWRATLPMLRRRCHAQPETRRPTTSTRTAAALCTHNAVTQCLRLLAWARVGERFPAAEWAQFSLRRPRRVMTCTQSGGHCSTRTPRGTAQGRTSVACVVSRVAPHAAASHCARRKRHWPQQPEASSAGL